MATMHPRVNVVLERPLFDALRNLARVDDVSLSMKARDLIREAVEIREDVVLSRIGEGRLRTFDRKKALTHKEVWGRSRKG